MRLITPKRLRENEDFMWRLADRQIDEFVDSGKCEFVAEFAGPFALLVIADLLGVPEEDRPAFREELQGSRPKAGQALEAPSEEMAHKPLEFLYDRFSGYIEDRRREPRDDVLTGLATATFPRRVVARVQDVAGIASNLFAAGQETTVRLLAYQLQVLAERPDLQELVREERDRIPNFVEEALRHESPVKGQFRLSRVPVGVAGVEIPAGTTVMTVNGAANRDPRVFEEPNEFKPDRANAPRTHRLRARHPCLSRRAARPCRGPHQPRPDPRPHGRHQDQRGQARPTRCSPLPVRPHVHPARADAAPSGVHAHGLSDRRRALLVTLAHPRQRGSQPDGDAAAGRGERREPLLERHAGDVRDRHR